MQGEISGGNIKLHSFYRTKKSKRRRYQCKKCKTTFSSQKNTAFFGLHHSKKLFDEVIQTRRTVRDFSSAPLGLNELSKILHQTYGITGEIPIIGGGMQPLRSAPSGGALYPAEIYLGINI